MIVGGVDPGWTGGISFLDTESGKLIAYPMPVKEIAYSTQKSKKTRTWIDGDKVRDLLLLNKPSLMAIEQINPAYGARRGLDSAQGAVSNSRLFGGFSFIRGILCGLNIDYIEVSPIKWKNSMGLINQDKSASVDLAINLFVDNTRDFTINPLTGRKKFMDGVAESSLIAYWCGHKREEKKVRKSKNVKS